MSDLYVCTWLYAESRLDESEYAQLPGRPSSSAFQAAYWRCIGVFFATSRRQQPDARHLFFTNVEELPTVDGVDVRRLLERLDVEIMLLPFTFVPPRDYYHAWRNQFYMFDITSYLTRRLEQDDIAILLDSDCVWVDSAERMHDPLDRDGVLVYVQNYPADWPINGLTRGEMGEIASALLGREVRHPLVFCGSEMIAATGSELARLTAEMEETWRQLMERHKSGEPTFNEEGQTLSYIYFKLQYPVGNGDPYIRRIWTGSFGGFNTALPTDHGLVIWHLPMEKRFGIRRLFPVVADPTSRFWSLPLGAEFRQYLGGHLGVHRNSTQKRLRDLGRRIGDKIAYR